MFKSSPGAKHKPYANNAFCGIILFIMAQLAISPEVAVTYNRLELPVGYYFASGAEAGREELRTLDEEVNGPSSSGLDRASWPSGSPDIYGDHIIEVGVRTSNENELVGIGLLTLKHITVFGELSHLMISPRHRHRGLARTIVRERVRIADALGAKRLATELAPTNTLIPLYRELGFTNNVGDKLLREIQS